MKVTTIASFHRMAKALLVVGALAGAAGASAQTVFLTFSGGSNTPLSITLSTSITFTVGVTPAANSNIPYFAFQNASLFNDVIGNQQLQINTSGAPQFSRTSPTSNGPFAIQNVQSRNNTQNAWNPNDLVVGPNGNFDSGHNLSVNMAVGDVFTLSAGTFTTTGNFGLSSAQVSALSGNYSTFLMDGTFNNLGAGSLSAVPEPSTYAAIAGAACLGFAGWRRRRRTARVTVSAVAAAA